MGSKFLAQRPWDLRTGKREGIPECLQDLLIYFGLESRSQPIDVLPLNPEQPLRGSLYDSVQYVLRRVNEFLQFLYDVSYLRLGQPCASVKKRAILWKALTFGGSSTLEPEFGTW